MTARRPTLAAWLLISLGQVSLNAPVIHGRDVLRVLGDSVVGFKESREFGCVREWPTRGTDV